MLKITKNLFYHRNLYLFNASLCSIRLPKLSFSTLFKTRHIWLYIFGASVEVKALYKFSINLFQGASKISPVLKTKDKFMVVGIILDQRCS